MEYMSTTKDLAAPEAICSANIHSRHHDRSMKTTADSVSAFRNDIREFEKEQKDRNLNQNVEIHFIRENYVRKEDMYRELGG